MRNQNRETGSQAAGRLGAAARELSLAAQALAGVGQALGADSGISGRWREETAAAVAEGVLMAMRRASSDPIISPEAEKNKKKPSLLTGASHGRLGASITGEGARSQSYGAIGGMIGYSIGGPIGGVVGGMLGGLLGKKKKSNKAALQRQWLNTPEGFEMQAYLYNLRRIGVMWARRSARVRVNHVNINITGSGTQAGIDAGRAFANFLGRQVALNSAVAQAPGEV